MNLSASFDWLKQYVDLKGITPEDFAARVSLSGPGIERLVKMGEDLDGVVVGEILEFRKHPDADRLNVSKVDIGNGKIIQVVFGQMMAMHIGAKVPVAVAPTVLPGNKRIDPSKMRGEISEGMLCLDQELGLLKDGVSIQFFDPSVKNGTPIVEALDLHDVILDVEVTSNRPDAMSLVGLAREAAAILKRQFLWVPATETGPAAMAPHRARLLSARGKVSASASPVPVAVTVTDKKLCPRFMAVRLDGVKVGPSPWWMKRRLLSAGIRPISNVVDITNFVMLELGQPMHAYDADKLSGGALLVRPAKKKETLVALDGKTYPLDASMLVIADAEQPVAVAGVMGGEATGVTSNTTSVIFEAASFDPVSVRRTARALNLYSDSQLRFEKGLSTEAPPLALARAVELCLELAGGQVSSPAIDTGGEYQPLAVSINTDEMMSLIGVAIPLKEVKDILSRLGFKLQASSFKLQVTVPWWRDHDIESGRDLVEEVARVHGYQNLPAIFPAGLSSVSDHPEIAWEDRVRDIAKGAGLTEAFTYSFVSRELLEKGGFDPSALLRVQNPLSSEFEFMRTSLIPSLLQVVADNQERFRTQKIFEVSHVYFHASKGELPDEQSELVAIFFGHDRVWKEAKGFAEHLYDELGMTNDELWPDWKRLDETPLWHPGRSVQAFAGEHLVGTVGEIHPAMAARFQLEGRVAALHIQMKELVELARKTKPYRPLPIYPEAKRDLALLINREAEVQALIRMMQSASPLLRRVEWFDTFTGQGIPADKKSVAFHLTFGLADRTLETREVDAAMDQIKHVLRKELKATVRE